MVCFRLSSAAPLCPDSATSTDDSVSSTDELLYYILPYLGYIQICIQIFASSNYIHPFALSAKRHAARPNVSQVLLKSIK